MKGKTIKELLEELNEKGAKGIEEITVEIPAGMQLKEGVTRKYIHVKADYMVPTAGSLDEIAGVKFEMVREDIGLVTQVVITDLKALANLKEILTHVLFEQVAKTGMYR